MSILTRDFAVDTTTQHQITHIRITIDYSLGGFNYLTHEPVSRGYHATVTPVTISGNMISYTAFTGFRYLLKEVTRQSKKAEQEALRIFEEKQEWLLQKICEQQHLKLVNAA